MNPEDLDALAEYSSPLVRGSEAVITITRPDLESNSYLSQLFALSGESSRRLTHNWRDYAPEIRSSWSGYLSAAKKEAGQLFVGSTLETAHRITDNHLGVSEFALDDEGARALYVARVAEPGRYGQDEDIPASEEAPRRITSAAYLSNGLGYTNDRPARAFIVDLVEPGLGKSGIAGGAEVPLSTLLKTPESDVHDPQFSPSGNRVSVVAALAPDHGEPDLRSTVWLLGGDHPEALQLPRMSVHLHRWVDDETVLLVGNELVRDELDFVAQMPGLFVHDTTAGTTRRLSDPETVAITSIRPQIVGHGIDGSVLDDASVIAVVDADGASRIVSIDLTAENVGFDELTFLTDETTVVNGFDLDGDTVVFTAQTPSNGAVLAQAGITTSRDAHANADASRPAAATLQSIQRPRTPSFHRSCASTVRAEPSPDGWPNPPERDRSRSFSTSTADPSRSTHGWFDETQVLTSAGYAVVYANPRGSGGRTREWGTAVQGNMAAPAMADVLAVLEHALAGDPQLDSSRLGVQGGSYGGYLTAMITAADHRFQAAIVERGYLDPDSFVGTSDIGRFFTEEYTTRDRQAIDRQSPLAHASQVRTPSLVMHSELDFRCPLEQAQQYYAALQRAGVDTELLIFPGENHELSRAGQPRHRRQRFEAMLDWWDQHLGGNVDADLDDPTTSANS